MFFLLLKYMSNSKQEWAYESLLSSIIGLISTMDLEHIKKTLEIAPNDTLEEYYKRAIEDHCNMTMYKNKYTQ